MHDVSPVSTEPPLTVALSERRMKKLSDMKMFQAIVLLALIASAAMAAENTPLRRTDVSFRHEVQRALEHGVDYLKSAQNSNGWWSTPDHPSVTALALTAILGEPNQRLKNAPEVKKGYAFVLSCARPDGGI